MRKDTHFWSRAVNSIFSNWFPFLLAFFLCLFPYFVFRKTFVFNIDRYYPLFDHFLFMSFFLALGSCAYFLAGKLVIKKNTHWRGSETSVIYNFILFFLMISVTSHLALFLIGGSGFASGGFIGARQDFGIKGIGIPLRLHLFALPMYFAYEKNFEKVKKVLIIFGFLTLGRSILLSERMAMLEFMAILWVFIGYYNIKVSPFALLKVFSIVVVMFFGLQIARLSLQREFDDNLYAVNDDDFLNTVFVYYGDTMNKFYLIWDGVITYPINFFSAWYEEIVGLRQQREDVGAYYFDLLSLGSPFYVKALNNLGGPAQDISDFGKFFGAVIIILKVFFVSYAIRLRNYSVIFLSISPMLFVFVVEYPRFNYLYLPYAVTVFLVALVFSAWASLERRERG